MTQEQPQQQPPPQQPQQAVELSAGTIEYEDTGGNGSAIVLLHGLAMNSSLWRHVIDDLRSDYRCIAPTLPLGAHRRPMRPDADLSMTGQVRLIAEFLERLDLDDVTLVGNDWGGALLLVSQVSEGQAERVGRLVLSSCEAFDNYPPGLPGRTVALAGKLPGGLNALVQPMRVRRLRRLVLSSCEAFDNYPPGLPGRTVALAGKLPGGLNALVQPMRLRSLRRLPNAFGRMSKRPIPDEITDAWLRPSMTQRAIRRDIRKYVRSLRKDEFVRAATKLADFDRPVLIVWAAEDRVMPIEHGRRLAELFPRSQYVEIADSYTLIPEDKPAEFAAHLRAFVKQQTPQSPSSAPA